MARVITLAQQYLQGHPKAGQDTMFLEKTLKCLVGIDFVKEVFDINLIGLNPKHHTIRFGRRWKTGDKASLRVWSGKPYRSPQIAISPDVTLRVVNIEVDYDNRSIYSCEVFGIEIAELSVDCSDLQILASNDGLSVQDFLDWFQVGKKKGVHEAQILIWGDVKEY